MFNSVNTCWTLVAAFLVYFMQAGFALCEAGFTRAKNTGNILMKNMMDFCIGTPCYWLIGFGIMFGGTGALIGGFDPFIQGDYSHLGLDIPLWVYIVFQTVFCATAATIVSGSMAERTNFKAYCVYSAMPSRWWSTPSAAIGCGAAAGCRAWASMILQARAAVHNVGGIIAMLGAALLGPRIGKYDKDGKPHAIPGHNLTAGALGVFILWFCWFGFNGGSSLSLSTDETMTLTRPCLLQHQPGRCRGHLRDHDLYLEAVRQARCLHDPERLSGRSGRHHSRLRRRFSVRRVHHRLCCWHPGGAERGVLRSASPRSMTPWALSPSTL